MNEQTSLLRLDFADICDSCNKPLNHKPAAECENDWHKMSYNRWKETSRINMQKYRRLKRDEENFKKMYNMTPEEHYAIKNVYNRQHDLDSTN